MREGLERIIGSAVQEGVFPGAVVLVAHGGEIQYLTAAGLRARVPGEDPMGRETLFDLASLTKPLATTLALMRLLDEGKITLDENLESLLDPRIPEDKRAITLRLLLCHSAGFTDWKPFYRDLAGYPEEQRKGVLMERLMQGPLAYSPGREVLYSDLGFMVLAWVIEERSGEPLPRFVERHFFRPLGLKRTFLGHANRPGGIRDPDFAATEHCPWRNRILRGEVHDENAWVLGGYCGHSGLFGTAPEVYILVDMLRGHYLGKRDDFLRPETVRAFFRRQDVVRGSTWALGWDTPSSENSSAGRYFSRNSVGHLGFTGTSVWMDLEKDVIVILLTNRVHPTRDNQKIRDFRPRIHDAVMEGLKLNC